MADETEREDHENHETSWEWSAEARPMAPVRLPGDEREQAVLLEAALRGNRVLLNAMLLLALVAALFGSWLVPAAILAIMTVTGRVTMDYASERNVDSVRLSVRRSRSRGYAFGIMGTVLTLAAMSYTGATGQGLLPLQDLVGTGPQASALVRSAATGLPAGGATALVVLELIDAVRRRRRGRN